MVYTYEDKDTQPDLVGIAEGVAASEMTDKEIEGCRWDEDPKTLEVYFVNELSVDDKAILDTIVSSN